MIGRISGKVSNLLTPFDVIMIGRIAEKGLFLGWSSTVARWAALHNMLIRIS